MAEDINLLERSSVSKRSQYFCRKRVVIITVVRQQ